LLKTTFPKNIFNPQLIEANRRMYECHQYHGIKGITIIMAAGYVSEIDRMKRPNIGSSFKIR